MPLGVQRSALLAAGMILSTASSSRRTTSSNVMVTGFTTPLPSFVGGKKQLSSRRGVSSSLSSSSSSSPLDMSTAADDYDYSDVDDDGDASSFLSSTTSYLAEAYPKLSMEFLQHVETVAGEARRMDTMDEDEAKAIHRASAFANMPGLVFRSRVRSLLSERFAFFSPDTGVLNKFQYIAMIQLLDAGFPEWLLRARDFQCHDDGLVTFIAKPKVEQFDHFHFNGETYEMKHAIFSDDEASEPVTVRGNYEVHVVGFDVIGRIICHLVDVLDVASAETIQNAMEEETPFSFDLTGMGMDENEANNDEEGARDKATLEARLENLKSKLVTLSDQESSLAYNKVKADMTDIEMTLKGMEEDSMDRADTNVGGHTYIAAALHALGALDGSSTDQAEVRDMITSVLTERQMQVATEMFDMNPVELEQDMGGISVPSCCLQVDETDLDSGLQELSETFQHDFFQATDTNLLEIADQPQPQYATAKKNPINEEEEEDVGPYDYSGESDFLGFSP